jgi:hypothetical protein
MAEDSVDAKEFEVADANHVRVLETNLLHASDVIYWLDGSTASNVADMTRIGAPLQIAFSDKPRAVKFLHTAGKTAFWQTPTEPMVVGYATEAQRVRPAVPNFAVAGQVADARGRYNPQLFSVTLGAGNGQAVVLYPSPPAVKLVPAGIIQGRIVIEATQQPLSWGLLTLTVTVALGETIIFRGQTDAKGDFVIALTRLPPLPLSVTNYAAVLRIDGDLSAIATKLIKLADLVAIELESTTDAGAFANEIPLAIIPGEIKRIKSLSKNYIAVRSI